MKLGDFVRLLGSEETPICLLDGSAWAGTFPAFNVPCEYAERKVQAFMPDENKGIFGEELMIKVWLEVEKDA